MGISGMDIVTKINYSNKRHIFVNKKNYEEIEINRSKVSISSRSEDDLKLH